jgi:hypothetical protein
MKWGFAHLLRDLIEMICGFAYYGARYPFDPNVAVVLERSKAGEARPAACGL